VIMQGDGNLVVYSSSGSPLWSSGTSGNPGASLVLSDNGNLAVETTSGTSAWTAS
jgi:hypothetical protein